MADNPSPMKNSLKELVKDLHEDDQKRLAELEAIILRIGAHLQTAHGSGDEVRAHMEPVIEEALKLIGVEGGEWDPVVSLMAISLGLKEDPEHDGSNYVCQKCDAFWTPGPGVVPLWLFMPDGWAINAGGYLCPKHVGDPNA